MLLRIGKSALSIPYVRAAGIAVSSCRLAASISGGNECDVRYRTFLYLGTVDVKNFAKIFRFFVTLNL
jgi:hypothetical protein